MSLFLCKVSDVEDGHMKECVVENSKVLVVKEKGVFSAVGAKCPHYGAPLSTGHYANGRVRCPWHGACFSTTTGDIEDFPAKGKLACYPVSVEGEDVMIHATAEVLSKPVVERHMIKRSEGDSRLFVVIGGGSAGATAVESLRAEGWTGRVLLLASEQHLPYDRTKLSKAMKLSAKQIQLRTQEFYDAWDIEVSLGSEVTEVDAEAKKVTYKTSEGETKVLEYEAALVATGASPNKLTFIPGHDAHNVMILRNPEDAYTIYKGAKGKNVVVVGSSFIGMEVASCLAKRASSVTVVGMEKVPFERVLGLEVGGFMQRLHEANGIVFKMSATTQEFQVTDGKADTVVLQDGSEIPADIIVLGAGVLPAVSFIKQTVCWIEKVTLMAQDSLSTKDRSLHVDEFLSTPVAGLFAAGDVASFPLHHTGNIQRIEHWAHAQNQGHIAAKNMIAFANGSEKVPFRNIPVFWTAQYGKSVRYAGRTSRTPDNVVISIKEEGDIKNSKILAFYIVDGFATAVASFNRDPLVMEIAEKWNAGVKISEEEAKRYL